MDAAELRTTLRELLNRRPWVPIRVEVADGRFTFIDTPLRVKWDGNGIVVSRFDAPTAVIPAEGVVKLTRLDELPGENGGMSYREFREANRKYRWAEPFVPYEVELLDGTRLLVTYPGQLLVNARMGVYSRHDRPGQVKLRVAEVSAVRLMAPAEVA